MGAGISRYAGLGAVATLWVTLGLAARRSGFPLLGERPLSWMAADPATSLPFSAGLVVAAVLLAAFCGHVRRQYRVGSWFSVAMLGGLVGQVIAGAVPIDGGVMANRVHTAAALALGVSLPVLMWRFATAQPPGRWRLVAYALFWVELIACAAGVVLSRRSVAPLAEILPAAGFHLWIVVLTLFGPQPQGLEHAEEVPSAVPLDGVAAGQRLVVAHASLGAGTLPSSGRDRAGSG